MMLIRRTGWRTLNRKNLMSTTESRNIYTGKSFLQSIGTHSTQLSRVVSQNNFLHIIEFQQNKPCYRVINITVVTIVWKRILT